MSDKKIHDPALYRAMCVPFESADAANAALAAFYEDVRVAREKHRVRDVIVVMSVSAMYPTGEGEAITTSVIGDELRAPSMSAWAAGYYTSEFAGMLGRVRRQGEDRYKK